MKRASMMKTVAEKACYTFIEKEIAQAAALGQFSIRVAASNLSEEIVNWLNVNGYSVTVGPHTGTIGWE